ncbi:MAG: response regulator transcription factor [Anaerolineae bacterium]|jgi:DNA-binding response OmpR family regulator|nr:MAG: response regulator transcription factor [Anaerolineae bacterium]MCL4877729.1 response regulator transcription factor [Anaerolineae bacterium]
MSKPYVLLIDDDHDVLGTLSRALTREGYEVKYATSGKDGIRLIKQQIPDLLILDVMMPGMDGIEVCRQLRADDTYRLLPILFLSAKSATEEVIEGLDAGGDDYIIKPFELTELHARVRALLRRSQRDIMSGAAVLQIGELILDSNTHQAQLGGRVVQLTATEHRLLRYLMEHANQALSPGHLLQAVWSYPPNTGDPDLVRAHVRNLRAKIEPDDNPPRYIRTIHGVGYMVASD